jgi:hypothetical protein
MQKEDFILRKKKVRIKTSHATHLCRKSTSLALKSSVSKPPLDELEKSIDKLDLEADDSLSKTWENEGPLVSNDCGIDTVRGTISYSTSVVKGAKSKQAKNIIEKKTGKKKKKIWKER